MPEDTSGHVDPQAEPMQDADGYYGDEGGDSEVDLSFLDDETAEE